MPRKKNDVFFLIYNATFLKPLHLTNRKDRETGLLCCYEKEKFCKNAMKEKAFSL